MSWHCSQALGADFSLAAYLDGLRSARSRLTTTAAHDSCSDRTKATSTPSRSGMTSELSTLDRGGDLSMSSQADSPAKTSVQRVAVQDLPESVRAFGSSLSASLASVGLALCSRKTVRTCVPVDLAASSKDLSACGMTFGGACWELGTSARPIDGTGCGSARIATPTATGNQLCPSMMKWPSCRAMPPTPTATSYGSNGNAPGEKGPRRPSLETMAKRGMWTTPSARDWKDTPGMSTERPDGKGNRLDQLPRQVYAAERAMLPTPTRSDATGGPRKTPRKDRPNDTCDLRSAVGGTLNPDWVEWLMAWPTGWTASAPLETDRFRLWLQLHGSC